MRPWSSLSGSLAFCGISAAIGKSLPDLRAWQDGARWVTIHGLALAKEVGWAIGVLGVFLKAQAQSVPSFQPLDHWAWPHAQYALLCTSLGSKPQQNLRPSQSACRQVVEPQSGSESANLGTCFGGAAHQLRTALASRIQVLTQGFFLDLSLTFFTVWNRLALLMSWVMHLFIQDFAHQMLFTCRHCASNWTTICSCYAGCCWTWKAWAATTLNSTKDGTALRPGSIETVCGLRQSKTRNHDQYYSGLARINVTYNGWEQEFEIFKHCTLDEHIALTKVSWTRKIRAILLMKAKE